MKKHGLYNRLGYLAKARIRVAKLYALCCFIVKEVTHLNKVGDFCLCYQNTIYRKPYS
nr:MAG TPA: hypothetical protein [Caudoviricetes sp.]